jgi:hypothetical protein
MPICKKKIPVSEGVYNALEERKGFLEEWDDYFIKLIKFFDGDKP